MNTLIVTDVFDAYYEGRQSSFAREKVRLADKADRDSAVGERRPADAPEGRPLPRAA